MKIDSSIAVQHAAQSTPRQSAKVTDPDHDGDGDNDHGKVESSTDKAQEVQSPDGKGANVNTLA